MDVPATGGKRGRGVQVSTNGSQDDNEVVWEVPVASVKTVNGGLNRNLRLLPVNGVVDQGLSCESVEGGIFALPLRIGDD
jgi:predicted RecA/RadA family phage recombinase